MIDPQVNHYYTGRVEPIYRSISGSILHLGIFEKETDTYLESKSRTKPFLAGHLEIRPGARLLDLGSGYGDAARYLASRFDCRPIALNLVHVQNVFARDQNRQLASRYPVLVVEGDFSHVPLTARSLDVVWSQEALLHAPDRRAVLCEAARVLRRGGSLLFTDILQTGPMAPGEAEKIYERVHVRSLGTVPGYRADLAASGLVEERFIDLSEHLPIYYQKLSEHLAGNRARIEAAVGAEYVEYTLQALGRWVRAGKEGKLGWAMFLARKP